MALSPKPLQNPHRTFIHRRDESFDIERILSVTHAAEKQGGGLFYMASVAE